jgi:hypothetical protein
MSAILPYPSLWLSRDMGVAGLALFFHIHRGKFHIAWAILRRAKPDETIVIAT